MADSSRKPSLFTRNATGLIRELSAFAVFVWAISYFPWLSSWAGIFWVTPLYYLNVNYYASLAVWAVIAIVIVLLYWQITSIMPRSGGDYVFVSRTINPLIGFIAGFLFFIAIIVSAGSGPYWAFAESGNQLSFAGQVLHNSFMANLGNAISPFAATANFNLMFGIGLLLLAVGAAVTLLGGRLLRFVIYGFFGYAFITLVVVVGIFLTTSHAQFLSDYNTYASSFTNTTSNIFIQAKQSGYTPGASLANLSGVIPILFVSIGPYPVLQMVGGEIKNPRRSLLYGLVGAELLSIAVWFALTYLLDRVISISFLEAWTVAASGGNGAPPVPTIFVGAIVPNAALAWFIFGGLFVSNLGWSWLGFTFLSRLVMSWSFDRVIPESFSYVSPRFRTPVRAAALICAIAVIPMYLEFYTTFIGTQVNSIFLLSMVWILTSIATIVIPFRKKGTYKGWRGQLGPIPIISILGAIGVIVFGYLAYNSVTNSAVGPFEIDAQLFIVAIFASAVVIYVVSYFYHKSRNLNLNAVFNELPPE